jgi:cytochrome c556
MVSWRTNPPGKSIMKCALVLALLASLTASPIAASDNAIGIVKSRQEDMKVMSAAAKSLNEFFAGKRKYDPAAFRAAADGIRERGGTRLSAHFADVFDAPASDASAKIRTEKTKFDELAKRLELYATQVSAAAQDGNELPEAMRMNPKEVIEGGPFAKKTGIEADPSTYTSEHAFHMMLQTCTSCHAEYRIERD